MKPTAEDLAEMTARRCQYECKTMNSAEYERIKIIIAAAIAAEREKERERFRATIVEYKNLYGIGVGAVADSLRAAYDHLLLAMKDKRNPCV